MDDFAFGCAAGVRNIFGAADFLKQVLESD